MANVYWGGWALFSGLAHIQPVDNNWNSSVQFTVSSVTTPPAAGDTYTNNGATFTVTSVSITAGAGTINAGNPSGAPAASGTLTLTAGSGDATITFSAMQGINWFSNPGTVSCCCTVVAGTAALLRVPTSGVDSVLIAASAANIFSGSPNINVGPPGTWPGNILQYGLGSIVINAGTYSGTQFTGQTLGGGTYTGNITRANISGGTFTGTCVLVTPEGTVSGGTFSNALNCVTVTGGTYSVPVTAFNVSGGTFNNTFTLKAGPTSAFNIGICSGGTFYGTFTRTPTPGTPGLYTNIIKGGTYSPTGTCAFNISTGLLDSSTLPTDPGFKLGGGTFSPIITVTGVPDILGAGLF